MKNSASVDWQSLAERKLKRLLGRARAFPTLARLGPKSDWYVDVKFVGKATIQQLNDSYRGANYPTDVLSFSAADPFRPLGLLGELVICLPVLKMQARSLGHPPQMELEVLLAHGLLHLLGLDHETNQKEALRMARWERKIIGNKRTKRLSGLIDRVHSGM